MYTMYKIDVVFISIVFILDKFNVQDQNVGTFHDFLGIHTDKNTELFHWTRAIFLIEINYNTTASFYKHGLTLIPEWISNYIP